MALGRKMARETHKWGLKAMLWDPTSGPTTDSRYNPGRRQGRPKTRWTDDITKHIQDHFGNQATAATDNTNSDTNMAHESTNADTDDITYNHHDAVISWITLAKDQKK